MHKFLQLLVISKLTYLFHQNFAIFVEFYLKLLLELLLFVNSLPACTHILRLISLHYKIRIREGDEWKTALKIKVNCINGWSYIFCLSNTPNTFMRVMTQILHSFLGKFISINFDSILIFSQIQKEYISHLTQFLESPRKEKLFVNLKKCAFLIFFVYFLGFIISKDGVADPSKVKTIREWSTSRTIHEFKSFHSLATFYRRFVKDLVPSWLQSLIVLRNGSSGRLNLLLKFLRRLRRS